MLFNIYAGLGGGFGGPNYIGSKEFEDENSASDYAYELACEEYDSYGGMHGLFNFDDARENPEDYGLSEDFTEDDLEELCFEDRESWITYSAILAAVDTRVDEDEREML